MPRNVAKIREYAANRPPDPVPGRSHPSPLVSDARLEKALYTITADGRALPGFEAYRYVVLRVPGLWWQVPLFYVPGVSRLLGYPIYNWIAANRGRLSALGRRQ